MSERVDPFELLRQANPVHDDAVGDSAEPPEAKAALEQILATRRRFLHERFRVRKSMTLVLLVVAGAGIGAGAWALTRGTTQHRTVGCYQAVSLQATTVIEAVKGSPVSTCASVWKRGDLGQPIPARLEACILPSGAIGVFPSAERDPCTKLHLPAVSRRTSASVGTTVGITRLKNELVNTFLSRGCLGEKQAVKLVNAELARLSLSDWQVRNNGAFRSTAPCASVAVDEAAHVVLIVPVPKP